jgi:predicted DNA-binding ribbon-helix-helix protein
MLHVSISDDTLLRLKEMAAEQKLTVEEYISRIADDVTGQHVGDFDEIAARILAKNKELYGRLAE